MAENVFETVLSYGGCLRILRRLDFQAVAYYLATLNQFNEAAFEAAPLTQSAQVPHLGRLLEYMLRGPALERAKQHCETLDERFVPLATQAVAATMELAGRFSPRTGAGVHLSANERTLVSHIILSFQNEALSRKLQEEFRRGKIDDWAKVPQHAIEQFIRNMAAHNPQRPYRNSLARLFAYLHRPAIAAAFASRAKRSLAEWFTCNLAMAGTDYLVGAFLAGSSSTRLSLLDPNPDHVAFNPSEFFAPLPPEVRERLDVLLRVATIDGLTAWSPKRDANSLADLLYEANQMHATPFVSFGARHILFSPMLLWNLFVCGLPHASLNAVRQRSASSLRTKDVQSIRGDFGLMFEAYVLWLFKEWFGDRPVRLLTNYYVKVDNNWSERDVAVIMDGIAYVFEIKGHVIDLDLRKSGSFTALRKLVGEPAMQAYSTALAFLAGEVRTAEGEFVKAVKRVVPVALVYDPVPLNLFTGDHFEPWFERISGGIPVFTAHGGRAGVLLMNVDDLEAAERDLRMDREPERLLRGLRLRAEHAGRRYDRLDSFGQPPRSPMRPAPVGMLDTDTAAFIQKTGNAFKLPKTG